MRAVGRGKAHIEPAERAMGKLSEFHLVWLTGPSCDGCTIRALGDSTAGGVEALLTGAVPGLPRLHLVHRALALESGESFVERLRMAARGELDPFGLVVEASIPDEASAAGGFFSGEGEEEGRPIPVSQWMDRLSPRAALVVAWGDCGVFGGPHSSAPNPTGATGAQSYLGEDYRSTLGLPVVNLPGCAAPPVLIGTLVACLKWAQGEGPPPKLDAMSRPVFAYADPTAGTSVVR